jgi:hypothetical protein
MNENKKQQYMSEIYYEKKETATWIKDKKFMKDYNSSKYIDNNFMLKFVNKHFFTKKCKKTFYFPNEIWDKILLFNGVQKIMNYEEILKIDIHVLTRAYSFFNDNNLLCLILLNYDHQHLDFHKFRIYFKMQNRLSKYIENNLLENNLLKNTLIYFHVKTYITFLSDYCSFVPLNIDIDVICNQELFHVRFHQYMDKKLNQPKLDYGRLLCVRFQQYMNEEKLNQTILDDEPDLEETNINNFKNMN